SFTPITHTVSASAGTGGGVSPATQTVNQGTTTTVTLTPASGYIISTVTGCDGTLSGNTYTTAAISASCLVSVSFMPITGVTHTVSAIAGTGGGISPAAQTVEQGAITTVTVTPNSGYAISTVSGCDGSLSGNTYTTGTIAASCSVSASFTPITHTVSALSGTGGEVSPATQTINQGLTTTVTVTPNSGYAISTVSGCSGSLLGNTFTTGAIAASCSVSAAFSLIIVNIIPIANNDDVDVQQNSQHNIIDILSNDSDADGDTLTVTEVSANYGTVTIKSDGTLSYSPLGESSETDIITYTISDGNGGIASAVVTVTVIVVENKAPIAIDDSYAFTSFTPVTLDVLINDSDPENDPIELVSVQSDIGEVEIVDGVLIYTPKQGVGGTFTITYSIKDSVGNIAKAKISVRIESENGPVITLPQDLCGDFTVNATGLYSRVDLGVASAVDRFGNVLPVSLINGQVLYPPGINEAFWQATDAEGNTAVEKQFVCVNPIISIEKNQTVFEGESATVSIYLNGKSPVYPVVVAFDVIGNESDHNLHSGEVVITSGTKVTVNFDTFSDDVAEGDEAVDITLSNTLNIGAKNSHRFVITENNVAPELSLSVLQNQEQRLMVTLADGVVTVLGAVYDPNTTDSFSYDWQPSDNSIVNTSTDLTRFTFDPSALSVGIYTLSVTVTDSGTPQLSDEETVYIQVVSALAELTSADNDGDLIPDNVERYKDTDGDGIPDYLDRISECNVLQEEAIVHDGYLIEGQSGVCLRRGSLTIGGQTGGAQITEDDIVNNHDDEFVEDSEAVNVGGIFDYIAYSLPDHGMTFAITMPQRKPIPANGVYRKYRAGSGWGFFIENERNSLWSTQGEPGYCPPPNSNTNGDNQWTLGLTEGHWCVQQIIEDGGINDDDGLVNSMVFDPGGVAVMLSANQLPVAVDDYLEMTMNNEKTIEVLVNDTDEDGDLLIISSATVNIGTVDIVNNQLVYQPVANYIGIITIDYGITDNNGGTDHAVAYITILNNAAPIIANENSTINQDGSVSINLLDNDSDAENDILSLISIDNAQVSFTADGQATFTPNANFFGVITINYVVQDSLGNTAEGQWIITVREVIQVNAKTSGGGALHLIALYLLLMIFLRRQYNRYEK
ncbi:hypothetical protein CXF85_11755, partial [Colwellia sp. 75C3]|uniref:Ig-like domain-containing protein n=1 Tax=Colwellia sp. 75C3 TaxID=888425 RepID=UPI000CBA9EF9